MMLFVVIGMLLAGFVLGELPVMGPIAAIEETDDVKSVANFATNEINIENRIHGRKWFTLTAITNPTLQSVVGRIYRMELILTESQCLNNNDSLDATIEQCPPSSSGYLKKCFVDVWHEAWTFGYQMRVRNCQNVSEDQLPSNLPLPKK